MLSLKVKNVMHQKHKVTNYCSQGCYGQGKSGKNEKAKKLASPTTFSLHGRRRLPHLSSWGETDNECAVLQEGNVGKNVTFWGDPYEVKPYFKMVHLVDTDCQKIVNKSPQLFNVMELYKIRT